MKMRSRRLICVAMVMVSLGLIAMLANDVKTLRDRGLAKRTLETKFGGSFSTQILPLGQVVRRKVISNLGNILIRHSDTGYFNCDVDLSVVRNESELLELTECLSYFSELQGLSLRGLKNLNAVGIENLSKLTEITELRIGFGSSLSPDCLIDLFELWHDLDLLYIENSFIGFDSSFIPRNWLGASKCVFLQGLKVSKPDLQTLVENERLRILYLIECETYLQESMVIATKSQSVRKFQCLDSSELLLDSIIGHLVSVRTLIVRGAEVDREILAGMAHLKKLQRLSIRDCVFEVEPWEEFSQLVDLEYLECKNCRMTGEGVRELVGLTRLKSLDFTGTLFSNEGNRELLELSNVPDIIPPDNF